MALLFALIVLLLVGARLFFSRQHLHLVSRLSDHERSWQLASGALTIGEALTEELIRYLNESGAGKPVASAPPEIQPLLTLIADEDGQLRREDTIAAVEDPRLSRLVAGVPDAVSLQLSLRLGPGAPCLVQDDTMAVTDSRDGGTLIRVDPGESLRVLSLHATACVGNGRAEAVRFTELRRVNITPPAVGKFILLLRQQGGLRLNECLDSADVTNLRGRPLVLLQPDSLPEEIPADPAAVRDLLDRQGWIGLGGPQRWQFNLSEGGGDGELREPLLPSGQFQYDPATESPAEAHELAERINLRLTAEALRFQRELGGAEQESAFFKAGTRRYALSSLINLFGSEDTPAPTVILGDVDRRFALLRGICNQDTGLGAPLPWLDRGDFGSDNWPGRISEESARLLRSNFAALAERYPERYRDAYDAYARHMSRIVDQPYNRANLEIVQLGLPGEEMRLLREVQGLPDGVKPPPPLTRLKVNDAPARFSERLVGRFQIFDNGGDWHFQGADPLRPYVLPILDAKAGLVFDQGEELEQRLRQRGGGKLRLAGVARLSGGLHISTPWFIARGGGGIIIAEGDIVIEAPIRCEEEEPLTLVSRNGSIKLATAEEVEAGLVAPRGSLIIGDHCKLSGFAAAKFLELSRGDPRHPRWIRYRRCFDPTDRSVVASNYRVMLWEVWRHAVP